MPEFRDKALQIFRLISFAIQGGILGKNATNRATSLQRKFPENFPAENISVGKFPSESEIFRQTGTAAGGPGGRSGMVDPGRSVPLVPVDRPAEAGRGKGGEGTHVIRQPSSRHPMLIIRVIGKRLMRAIAARSHRHYPDTGLYLSVVAANLPARRFYEALGAINQESWLWEPPSGGQVTAPRYVWRDPGLLLSIDAG